MSTTTSRSGGAPAAGTTVLLIMLALAAWGVVAAHPTGGAALDADSPADDMDTAESLAAAVNAIKHQDNDVDSTFVAPPTPLAHRADDMDTESLAAVSAIKHQDNDVGSTRTPFARRAGVEYRICSQNGESEACCDTVAGRCDITGGSAALNGVLHTVAVADNSWCRALGVTVFVGVNSLSTEASTYFGYACMARPAGDGCSRQVLQYTGGYTPARVDLRVTPVQKNQWGWGLSADANSIPGPREQRRALADTPGGGSRVVTTTEYAVWDAAGVLLCTTSGGACHTTRGEGYVTITPRASLCGSGGLSIMWTRSLSASSLTACLVTGSADKKEYFQSFQVIYARDVQNVTACPRSS